MRLFIGLLMGTWAAPRVGLLQAVLPWAFLSVLLGIDTHLPWIRPGVERPGHRVDVFWGECIPSRPFLKATGRHFTPTSSVLIASVALRPCQHLALSRI